MADATVVAVRNEAPTSVMIVSVDLEAHVARHVGVVGAGQLARMMGEAAAEASVEITVLATSKEDAAVATCHGAFIGSPDDRDALMALAARVDVITFDHELVDLDLLDALEKGGVIFRPSPTALRYAVDKAFQRESFAAAGLAVPHFLVVRDNLDEAERFIDQLTEPPVVKAARGGYDGRGVYFPEKREEALAIVASLRAHGDVVLEERLQLLGEVAQLVVRDVTGGLTRFPVVTTVQQGGMCVEVHYPSDLTDDLVAAADELSERIARLIEPVGVLAIEYFHTAGGLVINEVALRPHNSGHWTIEGASSSQFAQHLRAVSGQSVEQVTTRSPHVVMVNVVGSNDPADSSKVTTSDELFVHDYGKSWRPGRKLGHVTALGDDVRDAHVRAWQGARAYGTSAQEV